MRPEAVKLYHTRYEEKYDIDDDELYSVWEKLHRMTISDKSDKPVFQPKKVECMPKKQQVVSAALDEILTYPESKHTSRTNKGKSTSQMLKHLSSDQFIKYLTKKEEEKKAAEEEKQRRKEERERERKKKEKEKELEGSVKREKQGRMQKE